MYRCGMVYVDPGEIKWLPYVRSWVQKLNETVFNDELKEFIIILFEYSVENGLIYVVKRCEQGIHQVSL